MATRRWLGRAVQIAQVDSITVANTWAAADTCTLTINGKDLLLTVGTDVTVTAIATAIKEMINGDSQTGTGDHTFSQTGNNVGEYARITATSSAGVVTLTADDKAVPFTLSVTESTAGTGTATEATATSATGPNHWDNVDNWSDDTVPVNGDTVVFDRGDSDCLYAISTSIQPAILKITMGYTGKIGLSDTNEDQSNLPYDEYRTKYLTFTNDAGTSTTTTTIGAGDGSGSGRIKLDMGSAVTVTTNVLNTGQRAGDAVPSLLYIGSGAGAIFNITKGDAGLAFFEGESLTTATLRIGFQNNIEGDSTVYCGSGVTLVTVDKFGGTLTANGAITTLTQNAGETIINGSGAVTTLKCRGGNIVYNTTGTLGTPTVSGDGHLDFSQDMQTKTVTNPVEVYGARANVSDPFQVIAALVIDANETTVNDQFNLGTNVRLTVGTPA